jgi:2-O-methyltransferase
MDYVKSGIKEALRILKREPPITAGEFDLNTLPALLGKDDPVILDIGCNDGGHTLAFLRLFKNSKVFAFEPDLRALENFRNNVKDERATLFDLAISDQDGTTEFYLSDGIPSPEWKELRPAGWDLSGSIKKPKKALEIHPWCTFDKTIVVKTKRLDTWCQEQGVKAIDFIWADVQGAEENLIAGARETLSRTRYFYTEYCNKELYEGEIGIKRILKMLPDFELLVRFPNDVLLANRRV